MEKLVVMSNKSIEVADITFSEMENIVQVRRMIEPNLIDMLKDDITSRDVEELWEIQNQLRYNIENEQYRDYVELDNQFHMYFIDKIHNNYLKDLFEQLLTNYGRLAILSGTCKSYGAVAVEEHSCIIKALEQNNYDAAKNYVTGHIMNIYERYCRYWNQEPNKI